MYRMKSHSDWARSDFERVSKGTESSQCSPRAMLQDNDQDSGGPELLAENCGPMVWSRSKKRCRNRAEAGVGPCHLKE